MTRHGHRGVTGRRPGARRSSRAARTPPTSRSGSLAAVRAEHFFILSDDAHAGVPAARGEEARTGAQPGLPDVTPLTARPGTLAGDAIPSEGYGRPAPGTSTVQVSIVPRRSPVVGRVAGVRGADEQRPSVRAAEHARVRAVAAHVHLVGDLAAFPDAQDASGQRARGPDRAFGVEADAVGHRAVAAWPRAGGSTARRRRRCRTR